MFPASSGYSSNVVADCPSPSQVKKAGVILRRTWRGDRELDDKFWTAYDVLVAYRAAYVNALASANMGLRRMVRTEQCQVEVSQRLKRIPTILDKLIREPTLPLSSMQDIGGVRAVLGSIDEVRRVEARVKKNRALLGYADYIVKPRSSGYRAVHLIVEYQGRSIEIQLRTRMMHEWAITVERLSGRLGQNLKKDGEHAIQALMSAISRAMAIEEQGGTVDVALLDEIDTLRARANPYLSGGS